MARNKPSDDNSHRSTNPKHHRSKSKAAELSHGNHAPRDQRLLRPQHEASHCTHHARTDYSNERDTVVLEERLEEMERSEREREKRARDSRIEEWADEVEEESEKSLIPKSKKKEKKKKKRWWARRFIRYASGVSYMERVQEAERRSAEEKGWKARS